MRQNRVQRRLLFASWLLLALLCFATYSIYWRQIQVNAHASQHEIIRNYLGEQQIKADAALESFAALQSRLEYPKDDQERKFAQILLQRNPHIYCLQVLQRVPHEQIPVLESLMHQAGYPKFKVHDFDYTYTRHVQPLSYRPIHYPIIFMEPMTDNSQNVLGLDIDAVNFLAPARISSGNNIRALSTGPFRLIEGDIAYGMTLPVYHFERQGAQREWPLFVGLVIKANSLLPNSKTLPASWNLEVRYVGKQTTSQTTLLSQVAPQNSRINEWLFPKIEQTSKLPSPSQPYELRTSQQLGWQSWIGPIPMMLAISLGLLLALMLRWQQGERLKQIAHYRYQKHLQRCAHTDPLTHLANRQAFDQRTQHAIQSGQSFSLLYLDLNDFKPINDHYGHPCGDYVLVNIAKRLKQTVRSEDLVCRRGGDEFAILVNGALDEARLHALRTAIAAQIARGIEYHDITISTSASIGHASFPNDAIDIEQLIQIADQRMYLHKQELKAKKSTQGIESEISTNLALS